MAVEWFYHIIHKTFCRKQIFGLTACRKNENGHGKLILFFELLNDGIAIHLRHADIKNHKIGRAPVNFGKTFPAI